MGDNDDWVAQRTSSPSKAFQRLAPPPEGPDTPLAREIGTLASRQQYTILADTDHTNNAPLRLAGSKATMAELANAGVKHLAIEIYKDHQWIADDLMSGKINRDQFVAVMNMTNPDIHNMGEAKYTERLGLYADMMTNAQEAGITPRFADTMGGVGINTPNAQAVLGYQKQVAEQWRDKLLQTPALVHANVTEQLQAFRKIGDAVYDKLPPAKQAKITAGYQELSRPIDFQKRYAADTEVAAGISQTAGTDRTAIFYGVYHSSRKEGDLDAALGEKETATVNLWATKDEERAAEGRVGVPDTRDLPELTIYIGEGSTDPQGADPVPAKLSPVLAGRMPQKGSVDVLKRH